MMKPTNTSNAKKENKSAKRVRIALAVMHFIEVILTTFPFMQGDTGEGTWSYLTAFEIVVRPQGYNGDVAIRQAVLFSAFILLPMISFFFCVLDKWSNIKNFVSAATCVICVCMIVFFIGPNQLAIGSLVSMILYIVILFFTAQSFQASMLKNQD